MPGKCTYNVKWVKDYPWLREVKTCVYKAYCNYCQKEIDLRKMGEIAVKSHAKSARHQSASKVYDDQPRLLNSFFTDNKSSQAIGPFPKAESTSTKPDGASDNFELVIPHLPVIPAKPSASIDHFFQKNDVLKAEVLWTIQTVVTHNSYKSNENIAKLFKSMFPDSNIDKQFSCGERKSAYLCCFGIADYLKKKLIEEIDSYFVILFDESLNKKAQSKQMDLHVGYWRKGSVITRYLSSQFLGHATANDMLEHFQKGVGDLQKQFKNMLQISMDGPSVNWKFLDIFSKQFKKDFSVCLLNIGSCGLHIVHNAFKVGCQSTGWDISLILSSLYYLFKDSPARKEDYQTSCGSTIMPLKFVSHRWMENVPVTDRAIQVWGNVREYVKDVDKKKYSKPTCKSYDIVTTALKDKLIRAKLEFFRCVAMHLQGFLGNFQTDRPMVPFLFNELTQIIGSLMDRVIKRDVLTEASGFKLLKVNLDDSSLYIPHTKIDIGFSADKALKESIKEHKLSERQAMEFKIQCREFIIKLLKKLLEKCPATYSLVRYLTQERWLPVKRGVKKDLSMF